MSQHNGMYSIKKLQIHEVKMYELFHLILTNYIPPHSVLIY